MQPESSEVDALHAQLAALRAERALLCELLAADTGTLTAFMGHATRTTARVRALLRERTQAPRAYAQKLRRLKSLYARLAARAHAVPLPTMASQYENTARTIAAAAGAGSPSGDALLPALPLIEEGYLSLSTIAARLGLSLAGPRRSRKSTHKRTPTTSASLPEVMPVPQLELALRQLAERLAAEQGKRIELSLIGFELAPNAYASAIFDILNQLLRNAIEHGLETPAKRTEAGKSASGSLLAELRRRTGGHYELVFQDDGQGLQAERILQAGVERGLVPIDETGGQDPRQASTLIFNAGLTTAAEANGRGHGMCIVRDHVRRLQGQIQIATKRGQFMRVRIRLPAHISKEKNQSALRA